jgi:hypothetical protein
MMFAFGQMMCSVADEVAGGNEVSSGKNHKVDDVCPDGQMMCCVADDVAGGNEVSWGK